ncbi:MAG: hypothetical protein V1726_05090 [Methanobacteriota archaeon]
MKTKKITIFGLVTSLIIITAISAQAIQQLEIQAPSSVNEGRRFLVRVVSYGNGSQNGTPVPGARIRAEWTNETFYTNGNGTVLLTAPYVNSTRMFGISAEKSGYLSDIAYITVVNSGGPTHGKLHCSQDPHGD